MHVWRSGDNLHSFYHGGPGDGTQDLRLVGRCLYPPSFWPGAGGGGVLKDTNRKDNIRKFELTDSGHNDSYRINSGVGLSLSAQILGRYPREMFFMLCHPGAGDVTQ